MERGKDTIARERGSESPVVSQIMTTSYDRPILVMRQSDFSTLTNTNLSLPIVSRKPTLDCKQPKDEVFLAVKLSSLHYWQRIRSKL